MRLEPTPSEQALWRSLRGNLLGASFKRQVVIDGTFIVDLLASEARLVVEVDGGYHARRCAADARRDRALRRLGYRILHLDAKLVMRDLPSALALIQDALRR